MYRFIRAFALPAMLGLALTGCNTTGSSTNSDMTTTGSVGVSDYQRYGTDEFGRPIAASWASAPHSNQVSLKGDSSARALEQAKESFRDANYGHAEKLFRQAVEVRPDNATAWAGLAASYDQLGRFDLADRAYDQLQQLKKNDARVWNNRGYSYMLRGDYKNAAAYLNKAQALDPSLEEAQGNLHLLDQIRAS